MRDGKIQCNFQKFRNLQGFVWKTTQAKLGGRSHSFSTGGPDVVCEY